MEVLAEIMRHTVPGRIFVRRLHPAVAVVDAPELYRNAFAEMAEHDLQARVFVEQPGADQPQRMHRRLRGKGPVRAHQPGMAVIEPAPARQRVARVQIERHVELLHRAPERPVLRQIVIEHVVRRAGLREAVDQRADEAELLDAAGQFGAAASGSCIGRAAKAAKRSGRLRIPRPDSLACAPRRSRA